MTLDNMVRFNDGSQADIVYPEETRIMRGLRSHGIKFEQKTGGYKSGSYPPGWKGWHFSILIRDNPPPLKTPYFVIARRAYVEHVGEKRHDGDRKGESIFWYKTIKNTGIYLSLDMLLHTNTFVKKNFSEFFLDGLKVQITDTLFCDYDYVIPLR